MFFRYEGQTHEAARTAVAIRDRIARELRLPVTMGIARTKTLAKLFAESVKPFGAVAVLDLEGEKKRLGSLPVDAVAGIAGRRAARLAAYQVRNCLDFMHLPRKLVRSTLTITGERLWEELRGQPVTPLDTTKRPNKTFSRGGGFTATTDFAFIHAWLVRHVERLVEELEFHRSRAEKLTVFVEHWEAPNGVGVAHLDTPANRFEVLEAARDAFAEAYLPGRAACRIDLLAEKLSPDRCVQLSLFEQPSSQWEAVAEVKRAINEHFGRFALRSGATLPLYELYRDEAAGYDICDIRGKMCF